MLWTDRLKVYSEQQALLAESRGAYKSHLGLHSLPHGPVFREDRIAAELGLAEGGVVACLHVVDGRPWSSGVHVVA
jgi:hypothetical protein